MYFHCIFTTNLTSKCKRKSLAEVLLFHAKNWLYGILSFYEKKNRYRCRLNNSSKTFLNQWKPMDFCKLQRKKIGNFHNESETWKHWYITYELSSFFLNLSTGEPEQNRERGKLKIKIIATIAS